MNFNAEYNARGEPQAQRDWYNGIEFRSKLESKTAQALDNIGIRYEYEPDGYKLTNGMWYRPDFYLPDARQFIECKGKMESTDSAKIVGLVEDTGMPVLVLSYENSMMIMRFFNKQDGAIEIYDDIALGWCDTCGKPFFFSWMDTYKCPCCGRYDGKNHICNIENVGSATELFNYGQSLAANKPLYKQIAENFNN